MNKFARMLIQDNRQGRRDYNQDYARGGRRDRADYGYDMADYGWEMGRKNYGDYARGRYRADYEEDMASYNDYGKPKLFSHKDIETWKSMMRNEDGTRGAHFRPEQVKHACQQAGIYRLF